MENGKMPPWVRKVNTCCAWIMELETIPKGRTSASTTWQATPVMPSTTTRTWTTTSPSTSTSRWPTGHHLRPPSWRTRLPRTRPSPTTPWTRPTPRTLRPFAVRSPRSSSRPCTWSSTASTRSARRPWRKFSMPIKKDDGSSGRSTAALPTCLRRWSTMDGRCSPSTTTRDGTLTSQLIAASSWTFKIEYAQTSSGTAQSALSGHLCNSWTWRKIDDELFKMNVTIRKKCTWKWFVEATWSNDVKDDMEPSSSPGMRCHGRPELSMICLAHHASWTNASLKSWWLTTRATTSTSRNPQGCNAPMKAWQMSSTCSAQVITTTFLWKAAHLELETERQHQEFTKVFSAAAWVKRSWTSSSTRTSRTPTTSTPRSTLARRLTRATMWTWTPSPTSIHHYLLKTLILSRRSNDVEEFFDDLMRRTDKQPRGQSCGCTEALGTPPTRSSSDFWSRRMQVTPFYKLHKNMNVACVICTRGQRVSQFQVCRRTQPSTTVFKPTPFGSRFRVSATNSLCWWCQMRWPDFLQHDISKQRPPKSTSSNLRWPGLDSLDQWRPCRSMNTEPGHQMPCENGQLSKASSWWSALGKHTPDWPSWKGDIKWLARPSASSWSPTPRWQLTEMLWS